MSDPNSPGPTSSGSPAAETLGSYLDHLSPGCLSRPILSWPPDAFALATAVLKKSGAYSCILDSNWPPEVSTAHTQRSWTEFIRAVGVAWAERWSPTENLVPKPVREWWSKIRQSADTPLRELSKNVPLSHALLQIAAAADEACEGVQLYGVSTRGVFNEVANATVVPKANGSTLCREIDASKIRVLPKMHTPQSGLTIRSFSQNLSLCGSEEVVPHWSVAGMWSANTRENCLNLLVAPWPERVRPAQFRASMPPKSTAKRSEGLFTFVAEDLDSAGIESFSNSVVHLFEEAQRYSGRVDGVVFPELAMTPQQHGMLVHQILSRKAFLVCGLGESADYSTDAQPGCGQNYVAFDGLLATAPVSWRQAKHHRWKLERNQIMQYGLGTNLHPEYEWWEHISVGDRRLWFVSLREWLVMSVLICEDLARPDPAADLVRAVGPSLVIALLMDGPQLAARWSARYATVLADDPGCSVLSVTSVGMSELSRARNGLSGSRVIAIWKDALSGTATEIELPRGARAMLLNIAVDYQQEQTADGRVLAGAGFPVLAGYHPIT